MQHIKVKNWIIIIIIITIIAIISSFKNTLCRDHLYLTLFTRNQALSRHSGFKNCIRLDLYVFGN
jgi:hypothetical protein